MMLSKVSPRGRAAAEQQHGKRRVGLMEDGSILFLNCDGGNIPSDFAQYDLYISAVQLGKLSLRHTSDILFNSY